MKKFFLTLFFVVVGFGLHAITANAITQNQINAEVQIVCPDNYGNWFSGSGTIIDPKGIVLTNKHVVTDQKGDVIKNCVVGFVESINSAPNFGTTVTPNVAEVKYYTTMKDMDAAILYLNNPTNKVYPYINIWGSNSDALKFGDKLEVIGFPSIGGATVTYTSGDFSGFGSKQDGTHNYIKTTVPLEHGNSGGATYNPSLQFIGVPTMVIAGSLNSLSYILSVNSIKNWLSGFLGNNYQQEVIDQEPVIENPIISIQNDVTPPAKPINLHGQCYSDRNKSSYVYLGPAYVNVNPAQAYIANPYCEWTAFTDISGISGYYVYFGSNINGNPSVDGEFVTQPNFQPNFEQAGRYHFVMQAKDSNGNISQPFIFGDYHYLMLDEDKNMKSTIDQKIRDNKITNFYVYDYSFGKKGILLATIPYNSPPVQGRLYPAIRVPSNNLYIEWDGMTDRSFINRLEVKFVTGEFEKLADNFLVRTGMSKGVSERFYINAYYYEAAPFISKIPFAIIATTAKKFVPQKVENGIGSSVVKLRGYILLQVESHGEAWYVNPADGKRYYMKDGATAYEMMRRFGLGITNANLDKVPQEGDNKQYPTNLNNLKGKILLQIEDHGEAWYVDPKTSIRYYMKDGDAAYTLMRYHSLGIKNADLEKIPVGNF